MSKDSYYFSHDSNARNDIKVIKLRRALGMEGYGIYFSLIEILREQQDFRLPIDSINDIAFDLRVSEEKVSVVINSYELFLIEDNKFFSARLLRSMDDLSSKRQKYIDAGRKGGEASVKQRLSIAQPLNKSKVNKVNNNITLYRVIKHLKISEEEFEKLVALGYTKSQVDKILDCIENYKKNSNYTSLYLTSKKWLEKEHGIINPDISQEQNDFLAQL